MRRSRQLVRYGPRRQQVGELWRPADESRPAPVVVLIHGGFWRAVYTKRLMHRLAADVTRRGWAAWNVEYRRVGRGGGGGGWPATLADVGEAVDHVRHLEGADVERVAVCGHSAGGQLALWAAGRDRLEPGSPGARTPRGEGPLAVRAAVSLAGVVDLVEAARLRLGDGAVQAFLGGDPADVPERYAAASPAELRPEPDQLLVHGTADTVVPLALSEKYAALLGNRSPVTLAALPGVGHLGLIDPAGPGWHATLEHLGPLLDRVPT